MRITGGQHRGRIIKVPDTGTVRPTTDKMRQQLFNMLVHSQWQAKAEFDLDDAHVLDGFCGSGALGLEALSRGSASCVFVDIDGKVVAMARANAQTLKVENQCQFIIRSCQTLQQRPDLIAPRNLVLLDPPYRKDMIIPSLNALDAGNWMEPNALVIAESEKGWRSEVPSKYIPLHVREDGDSALNIWQYSAI